MKDRIVLLVLALIFKIVLDIIYVLFTVEHYGYMEFFLDVNWYMYLITFIVIFLTYIFFGSKTIFNYLLFEILHYFIFIPSLSYLALTNGNRVLFIFVILSQAILVLVCKINYKKIVFDSSFIKKKLAWKVFLIAYGFTLLLSFYEYGLPKLEVLDLNNVYEVRENISYTFFFSPYLLNWLGRFLNIFLVSYGLYKKKNIYVLVGLSAQLLIFLQTGHKYYLFYIGLYAMLLVYMRYFKKLNLFQIGIIALLVVSFIIYITGLSFSPASLLARRTFHLPAQLLTQYHDFGINNGYAYLSHSVLGFMFDGPIYVEIPKLIANEYYTYEMNANAGFLADSFINFGYIGMIVFTGILGFFIALTDGIAKRFNYHYAIVVTLTITFMSIINSALLTSILTGGMMLVFLMYIIEPNENEKLEGMNKI